MANDYLVSKWKIWYKSLDVNHDGKISFDDVEESRQKFSELSALDADKQKAINDNFLKWWNKYIFHNPNEQEKSTAEISEADFVSKLSADYSANKQGFLETMQACFDLFFDVIDTNKDRSISEDEFLIAFKAYGHENVALDTSFFKAYNPTNNLVPLKDIVTSWVTFTTSEDSSKDDVVKKAFESGV